MQAWTNKWRNRCWAGVTGGAVILWLMLAVAPARAQAPMTEHRLGQIVRALDPQAIAAGQGWQMRIKGVTVLVISDTQTNRVRAIVAIRAASDLSEAQLRRLMQANFDSALDGRYAIAQDILWAAFIHPLTPLEKDQFISGLGQIVNLAQTYGTLYSGGALQFGGGDSAGLQRQLIDELLRLGEEI